MTAATFEQLLAAVQGHEDTLHDQRFPATKADKALRQAAANAATPADLLSAIKTHRDHVGHGAVDADETLWAELDQETQCFGPA